MTRVLVVDDKEMMRDSVATMLARKGHGVVVANGGADYLPKGMIRKRLSRARSFLRASASGSGSTYGVPQIRQAGDLKVGLWAPGDALDLDDEEAEEAKGPS